MNPDETPRNQDDPEAAADGQGIPPADTPANENLSERADPEVLAAELADAQDKVLRALAEVENVRRRAQRDKEDATRYAIAGFARDMVGVADNLRRALDSITPQARAASEGLNALAVGVEMTESAMLAALERNGVKPIDAVGQPFDANRHEALFEIPDDTKPAGTVLQVMERGYMLRDRLLRPAKVGIAKGGPRAEPRPDPAGEVPGQRSPSAYERRTDAGGTFNEEL